jgi:hypothetical protein
VQIKLSKSNEASLREFLARARKLDREFKASFTVIANRMIWEGLRRELQRFNKHHV